MDKFTENLTGGLRRFAMAGVGAVALTIEKSKEIIDRLAERGETTASEGAAACDNLQKKMNEQLAAFTARLRSDYEQATFERLLQQCAALSPEQKAILIERLTAEPESAGCECAPAEPDEAAESPECSCAHSDIPPEASCECTCSASPEPVCCTPEPESCSCAAPCECAASAENEQPSAGSLPTNEESAEE